VINRVIGDLPDALQDKAGQMGTALLATLPYDPLLVDFDAQGRPLVELPDDAPMSRAVADMARHWLAR
jgi:CO dehydrogenase nickel-insertion accessory protein CooC1